MLGLILGLRLGLIFEHSGLSRDTWNAVWELLAVFLLMKLEFFQRVAGEGEVIKRLEADLATCKDNEKAEPLLQQIEDLVYKHHNEFMAFKDKGPEPNRFIMACSYSDE